MKNIEEPQTQSELSPNLLQMLDRAATAFDKAWQKGEQPRIEGYLKETPQSVRGELFKSLLRIELAVRRKQGRILPLGDYLSRFPEFSAVVSSVYEQAAPASEPREPQAGSWYYFRNNLRIGPFSFDQLKQLIRAGDLQPKDRVAPGNVADWQDAGSVPGLFPRPGESGGLKPPAPGDWIRGDYVLLEMVGRGGMGDVFKAYRFSLRQEVALKIVRYDRFVKLPPGRQNEILAAFRKEMQATANLHHEHIVSIFDNGDHNGLPFYTMNFLDKSLANLSQYGPLQGQKAAEYVQKIAGAVDFAHQQGIIHRDIKPHNILLEKQKCVLSDLGLATTGDLLEGQGHVQVVGTPPYMAPEQAQGTKADKRTDVYGLGATLYHLITGRPPHQGSDWAQVRQQVLSAEPLPPRRLNPGIDRNLEAITLKCLEKEPDKRYASAALLAEDLDRYLQDRPVSAKIPYLWERVYKWARRERLKASLVFGILLLLVLFLLSQSWSNRRLSAALDTAKDERAAAQTERDRATTHAVEAEHKRAEAAQEREKALAIASILGTRVLNKFKQQEHPEKAIEDLTKHIDSSKKLAGLDDIRLDLAESHRNLAFLYVQKNRFKEAAAQLRECTQLQEELSKKHAIILVELALNYMELGTIYGQIPAREDELASDQDALNCLQRFQKQGHNNPLFLAALGEAHTVLGIDFRRRGEAAKSRQHQKDAIAILEELNRNEKGNVALFSFQKQLGKAYQQLGNTLRAKEPQEALVYLEKAKEIFAGKSQFLHNLTEVNLGIGAAFLQLKQPQQAGAPLEEAIKLVAQLLQDISPKARQADQFRQLKAEIISAQAKTYQLKGEFDLAEKHFLDSVKLRQLLAANPSYTWSLPLGLAEQAEFYRNEKRYLQAVDSLNTAIDVQEELVKKFPNEYGYRATLGFLWYQQGIHFDDQKMFREALSCFLNAKKHEVIGFRLTKGSETYGHNLYLTFQMLFKVQLALIKSEAEEAVQTIEQRREFWPDDRAKHWAAALDLAEIYQVAKSEKILARIMAFLDQGLEKRLLDMERLNSATAFQHLRSHPEFKKLSMKYENR